MLLGHWCVLMSDLYMCNTCSKIHLITFFSGYVCIFQIKFRLGSRSPYDHVTTFRKDGFYSCPMQLCHIGMYQTLNIQSVYFMTWANHVAFSVGLFANPLKSEKMHHHKIFSKSTDIVHNCFTKMVEAWEFLCQNTFFSTERRLLLINNCLREFYMVGLMNTTSTQCTVYYK